MAIHYQFEAVGSILEEDIYSPSGLLLLRKGISLSERHIIILQTHFENSKVNEILKVINHSAKNVKEKQKIEEATTLYSEGVSQFYDLTTSEESPTVESLKNIYTPMFNQIFKSNLLPQLLRVMRDSKDSTYTHSLNVAMTAALIGKILGKSEAYMFELAEMGVYHDLGKLSIPLEIIHKPEPLDSMEWEVVKNHPILGAKILKQMGERRKSIIEGTLYHHERLDGSGYPKGIKGQAIPENVQILSVADIYDAITSDRFYKKGKTQIKAALEIIKETDQGRFNKAITYPFVNFLFRQHLNHRVKLSNGETGTILKVYKDHPHRPDILLDDEKVLKLNDVPEIDIEDLDIN